MAAAFLRFAALRFRMKYHHLRAASITALFEGKNWGMIAIPRVGQEIVVDFLEGDPDQPIVTRCV